MGFLEKPVSWAARQAMATGLQKREMGQTIVGVLKDKLKKPPPHSQHPNFGHLTLLVFEAVLEVVCVSLPGYIVARQGMFDAEAQKFVANLNVALFTPCLSRYSFHNPSVGLLISDVVFTKLASQLTAEKLVDLAIIPFIFIIQTLISYVCANIISRLFRFKKRQTNFVIAMGTLKGLHWDKVPGDNDDEVAARGILYLLIFQQLGQLLRWSWGYNVLLKPADKYTEAEGGTMDDSFIEDGPGRYRDDPNAEDAALLGSIYDGAGGNPQNSTEEGSGETTPVTHRHYASVKSSRSSSRNRKPADPPEILPTPANGNVLPHQNGNSAITSFPHVDLTKTASRPDGLSGYLYDAKETSKSFISKVKQEVTEKASATFESLPPGLQRMLSGFSAIMARFLNGLKEFMNPPLWAMLIAIVIASVPALQHLFFDEGTFIRNSVTRAIGQSGGVAVPLILVVLGANLARNTLPADADSGIDKKEERNLLIAALVSRMLLPTLLMAPLLALTAKYIPVSIVDDKIFIIVCFLLTGAPTALQLAQICQVNNVFMGVMSKILFQSYVVWILPSTLILVLCALEVVEWAEY